MNTLVERIGWTLIDSLWEGGLIWIGLAMAMTALRRQSAQTRYLTGCAALALAVVAPVVTFLSLGSGAETPLARIATVGMQASWQPTEISPALGDGWSTSFQTGMAMILPWIVVLWVLGCIRGTLKLAADWANTKTLMAEALQPLPEAITQQCQKLAQRLGISQAVPLSESALVAVPSVVGWLRPVILVPIGAFSGLSAVQIEALLAHELAHICRHDFPINLLQSVTEVLFFFNPAIGAINRGIRRERENACDDIAVALTGAPFAYAKALAQLEEARQPTLVLAASGQGELLGRIRRLAAGGQHRISLAAKVWLALAFALVIAVGAGWWQARAAKMYEATATMQFDKPATVVTTQGVMDAAVHSDFDINTYIQDLESNKVRQLVADSLTDEEKEAVLRPIIKRLPPGQAPPFVTPGMLGNVIVSKVPSTFLLRITIQHQDPEAAAIVANAYVQTFMHYLMSYTGDSNEYAVTYLKDRADTLQKESEDAEAKLEKYMRNKKLVSLDNSMDLVSSTMMTVQKALDEAEINKIRLNATAKEIESYRGTGGDLTEIRYIAQHGNVPVLRNALEDLRRRPKSPDFAAQIAAVQQELDQEISRAIADLKAEVREQQEEVNDLAAQKDAAENKEFDLLALKADYNSLVTQRDVAKSNYMSILDRLNQTQTSKNLQNVPLHPLDTAVVPSGPYWPVIPRIVRSCSSLGVIVFLLVLLGLSVVDYGWRPVNQGV